MRSSKMIGLDSCLRPESAPLAARHAGEHPRPAREIGLHGEKRVGWQMPEHFDGRPAGRRNDDAAFAVVPQTDGKIVAAGGAKVGRSRSDFGSNEDFALARYLG